MIVVGAEHTVKIIWTGPWFGLAHEAGPLGVVVVYSSLAANGRLGGVVGKGANTQSGASSVEVQLTVVVNEACGDDDMVSGTLVVGGCPGCVPAVLGEGWNPQRKCSRAEY